MNKKSQKKVVDVEISNVKIDTNKNRNICKDKDKLHCKAYYLRLKIIKYSYMHWLRFEKIAY